MVKCFTKDFYRGRFEMSNGYFSSDASGDESSAGDEAEVLHDALEAPATGPARRQERQRPAWQDLAWEKHSAHRAVLDKAWEEFYSQRHHPLPGPAGDQEGGGWYSGDAAWARWMCVSGGGMGTSPTARVAAIGKAGDGKSSLVNHLPLHGGQRSYVSNTAGNVDATEFTIDTRDGEVVILDIPGFGGAHQPPAAQPVNTPAKRGWWRWGRKHAQAAPAETAATKTLEAEDIIKEYKLLEMSAIILVVGNRFLKATQELVTKLENAGKVVIMVFTHSEDEEHYLTEYGPASKELAIQLQARLDQALETCKGVPPDVQATIARMPTFFVITKLRSQPSDGQSAQVMADYERCRAREIAVNRARMDMPAFLEYLQLHLVPEVRLTQQVGAAVRQKLEPFQKIPAAHLLGEFGANVVAGAGSLVIPIPGAFIAGTLVSQVIAKLGAVLAMCEAVGLVPRGAVNPDKLKEPLSQARWSDVGDGVRPATNEDMARVSTPLLGIVRTIVTTTFGELVANGLADLPAIAVAEAVSVVALLPIVGAAICAVTARKVRRRLVEAVAQKAIAHHRRYLTQSL
ncbi:hypothetical protein GPECTOR_102g59 [Gonium pectorale]|uniref:G domain-containing protein n=1 Tax=Gonium pectorale TaxID=33097 RepID=A0A150FZQ8_GONPE|nr:hypothetical protein GPECTOR_102g59 [Gonium pectorale]|eukprot:KXZ43106.1 hypothetical protein GPECTOR_102g59 [Gonium pectorale]